jgi:carbamoyl-phosphate synthase small subunit
MPLSIETLIDRLGGPDAAAKLAAVSTEAVRKWRSTGAIPSRHWATVLAATGLSLDDLPGGVNHHAPTHKPDRATAALVLGDGRVFWGIGFGPYSRPDQEAAELCFSTGMAGYQETLTDPSFAGQIITFTFPHIGNVGSNAEDIEASQSFARGLVLNRPISKPSNWRSTAPLEEWCARMDLPGIHSVDTRALTIAIREDGAPNALLAYPQDQKFDIPALVARARAWPGLTGMDLAGAVSCTQPYEWTETLWDRVTGFGQQTAPTYTVVAVDYGAKRNIFRNLASAGCRVIVVPATSTAEDILRHQPDGVFLSNGPGDPAATAHYAAPTIRRVLDTGLPLFGICLGHQLLATALGGKTYKLARGHRGANQPVQDLATGRVEITSQNHGFAVDEASLPHGVTITHRSLFDGSNEGIACPAQNCFSVQYHPEASPGPSDANHLFTRFTAMMRAKR